MNSFERVNAVIKHNKPDRVPKYDQFWPETLEKWKMEGYPGDMMPEDYFDFDICIIGGIDQEARFGYSETLEESEAWIVRRDGNDALLKTFKNKTGVPEHIGFGVNNREKWFELKQYLTCDEKRFGNIENIRSINSKKKEEERFTVISLMDLFECAKNVLGHEELLVNMALDPEWISDVFKTYTDFQIEMLELFFSKNIPVDGIWVWGDLAYNHGPFYSKAMYSELVQNHHKRLFDFIHSKGLPLIFHTCGRAMEMIPLLIESGIDCLQPMEAKAGMDVRELKQLYGNSITFMGNIDVTILSTGNRKLIEAEVMNKLISAKENGGYIYHSDHSIPPLVSFDTYKYVMELVDKYGNY